MRRARVRGVQVHDEPVERAAAGQRVAVNLTGLAADEIDRGDVLVAGDGALRPTYLVDAELEFDAESEPRPASASRSTTARARRRRG